MRHHANDISAGAADAGDVIQRSVRIRGCRDFAARSGIAEHHTVASMQLFQGSGITEVVALHVADGDGQYFPVRTGIREGRLDIFHPDLYRLSNVLETKVAH